MRETIIASHMQELQETSFNELPPFNPDEPLKKEEGEFEVLVIMKLKEILEEQRALKTDQRMIGHYIRGLNDRLNRIESKLEATTLHTR